MPTKPPFWSRVNKDAFGCWEWTGPVVKGGYGIHGREKLVHRIAYRELVGEIPEGMVIDHLCAVRHCVNPDHLEATTQAENNRRSPNHAERKRQTHCKFGHSLEDAMIKNSPGRGTSRVCRACNKIKCHGAYLRRRGYTVTDTAGETYTLGS